jgi:hypothetical protein
MKKLKIILAATLVLLLAACAKPLPPEKAAYAGTWEAPQISLVIGQDGRVAYKHQDGNVNKSVEAPLQKFEGDNFVVGVGSLTTTFVVSVPPHQEADDWKMTVDGVVLTRAE